jgi:hypothetical protein
VNYLTLALRARLQDLITAMILASEYRTDSQVGKPALLYLDSTPMWSLVGGTQRAGRSGRIAECNREGVERTGLCLRMGVVYLVSNKSPDHLLHYALFGTVQHR